MDTDPYTRAERIGAQHGRNAAEWWCQDAIGGRASGDVVENARRILSLLDDCDPSLEIPQPDLSGQWADGYSAPWLLEDCTGLDETSEAFDDLTGLCDCYEDAFIGACESEIARQCRLLVEDAASDHLEGSGV